MERQTRVSLAPTIDLHTGYHGAIVDSEIPGVSLKATPATHWFVYDGTDGFSPHAHLHFGEFIEVSEGDVVHSARWPVLGCSSWIADTDDLMYPVLCGRTAFNPDLRKRMRDRDDEVVRTALRTRAETMTSCYAHDSCRAILLRGHPRDCVRDAREWFDWLGASVDERFFEKIVPVRPAQQSMPAPQFEAKWTSPDAITVIFCGRDFDYKNGHLALRAMRPLLDRFSWLRFVYIGKIPEDLLSRDPGLLGRVEHHPQLNHIEVIEKLRESHIFFHPSKGDSIGISLLEAMGAGLAVVVARGGAMEYTDELFAAGGGLLLNRDPPSLDEEAEFTSLLEQLLVDLPFAKRLGEHNLEATAAGEYSIDAQSRRLSSIYRSGPSPGVEPLRLPDIVGACGWSSRGMASAAVWQDMRQFRASISDAPGYKCILV